MKGVLDLLALAVVAAIFTVLEWLPDPIASRGTRAIISVLLFVFPRAKKAGRRNLELCFPEKSVEEREAILKRSFSSLARNLFHYAKLPRLTKERAAALIDYSGGKALCERLRAEHPGKGVILGTLHYGSFELIIQLQTLHVRPAWILARGFGLDRLDNWWFARRERLGCRVFRRKGAFNEIVKRLQEGEDVAILYDQNVKRNHAVFVDFFGRKAATTRSLALAALRTGAPIAVGVMHETDDGRFELLFDAVDTALRPDEDSEAAIARITGDLNQIAENFIRKHPEDWFWIHRRFKTRPEGEPENLY